jgi:hypothetical protein
MDASSFSDDQAAQIAQLQQQQSLFTQALKEMLQGNWSGGAQTVEGLLYALDPNMTGTLTLDTPVTHSEDEEEPPKA